jgi:GH25 family lysozyme M1 (1,4-beta-N-acetylmuramidase)
VRRCPLWVAHWDVPHPQPIEPWDGTWPLWQYSDHGRVAGVPTKCDTDYFRGSASDFANLIVS